MGKEGGVLVSVDPGDLEDTVGKLLPLFYSDKGLRKEWSAKSLGNVQKYAWDAAAEKLVKCLEAG